MNNNKPGCATEDISEVYNFNQTKTGIHPWNGEIVVYVDKDDKTIRKVKKILLINIWPTYDQIDLRPVSQNGSRS
jgi:hypothetical protein